MASTPSPPRGLNTRGRKLWRDLQSIAEFSETETQLLVETCRCLDTIDALTDSIEKVGTMTKGSQDQWVVNPAIAERRQQQASLARLVTALHLPEEAQQQDAFNRKRGKAGAAGRWGGTPLKAVN